MIGCSGGCGQCTPRAAAMACSDGTTGTGTAGTAGTKVAAATASARPSENGALPEPEPEIAVNRGDDWRDTTRDNEPL